MKNESNNGDLFAELLADDAFGDQLVKCPTIGQGTKPRIHRVAPVQLETLNARAETQIYVEPAHSG